MPNAGLDIQDTPVYWCLQGGKYVCWSVREMAMAKDTELAEEQSKELYELVAQKFDLCCIGAQ